MTTTADLVEHTGRSDDRAAVVSTPDVTGMTRAVWVRRNEKSLSEVDGVTEQVNLGTEVATVTDDPSRCRECGPASATAGGPSTCAGVPTCGSSRRRVWIGPTTEDGPRGAARPS